MIYVLMILSPVLGWHIADIEGNPFPTFAKCTTERNLLIKKKKRMLGNVYYSKVRCVPHRREVRQ